MPSMQLLLITGAGASAELAADARRLPLMGDWAERLRDEIGPQLSEMTGLATVEDGEAFEEALGELTRWRESLPLVRRFIEMMRLGLDGRQNLDLFLQGMDQGEHHMRLLERGLHKSLFDEFGPQRLDDEKARAAYQALLEQLGDGNIPRDLIFATTNYDRSLEMALAGLGLVVRTGLLPHSFKTSWLRAEGLGTFQRDTPSVLYLHGAVGWYLQDDGRIKAAPADAGFNDTLGRPAVLYPSLDKNLDKAVTRDIWEAFGHACSGATHIFVLGHSLHDKHLVQQLAGVDAPVAVTYRSEQRPTASAAERNVDKERRICDILPSAYPVAAHFGPDPSFDRDAIAAWRSGLEWHFGPDS